MALSRVMIMVCCSVGSRDGLDEDRVEVAPGRDMVVVVVSSHLSNKISSRWWLSLARMTILTSWLEAVNHQRISFLNAAKDSE